MSEVISRPEAAGSPGRRGVLPTVRAYVALTKPRVVELLLITTVPAMVLAQNGFPDPGLVLAVLVGGALAAGGANTVNSYVERDRDQLMRRTRDRPLVTGAIRPGSALVFGIVCNVVAFGLLWGVANLLSACLTLSATLFYVFVYTLWLKPRTAQNIVIGGAAGAIPTLVGWAAVTGTVAAPAWVLFAMVFFWTPPHFWALALRYRDDYAAADFPMLPVTKGVARATREMLVYSVVVVAVSLTLGLTTPVGPLYVAVAVVAGAGFVAGAVGLVRNPDPTRAIRYFTWSNLYLAILFVTVAVDVFVRRI